MLVKEQDRVRSVERFAIGLDSVWLIAGKAITKTLTLKDASVRLSPDYSNYPLLPQLTTSLIGVGTWMAVGYAFAWNEMLNWFVATEPQLIMGMTLALAATVLLGHSEFINMEGF